MLAVIGSLAVKTQLFRSGKYSSHIVPNDIDMVGTYDEIVSNLKHRNSSMIIPIDSGKKLLGKCINSTTGMPQMNEAEIAWENSTSQQLLKLIEDDPDTYNGGPYLFASLDVCYMLKMTHRFKKNSPHFLKTMRDIHFLRSIGAQIRPEHKEFYKRRLKETLSYKHPKLNQTKKDFFTDDVPYVYDHDSIHEAMKLYEKPAYSYFKEDEAEVKVSKDLFFKLPYEKQLAAVYEESCVLALERSQIPYPDMDPLNSFKIALEKVCTSITSGWFREFAWENYNAVMLTYANALENEYYYTEAFKYGLDSNIIRPHKKN